MPEGNTARTKQIMQNASMMRKHGLAVRGTTGVRRGSRSFSPVDGRSAAAIRMRQERKSSRANDPIITRLGVRGLHPDGDAVKPISGRVQKRSIQKVVGTSRLYDMSEIGDDVAIKVQISSSSRLERRIGQAKPRITNDDVDSEYRISRSSGNGIPRVTVKIRGGAARERAILRDARTLRKPVHARLSTTVGRGRPARAPRLAPISLNSVLSFLFRFLLGPF